MSRLCWHRYLWRIHHVLGLRPSACRRRLDLPRCTHRRGAFASRRVPTGLLGGVSRGKGDAPHRDTGPRRKPRRPRSRAMTTALLICAVAVGAALGGIVRYALAVAAQKKTGTKLAGTFTANMFACLIAGMAYATLRESASASGGAEGLWREASWAAVMVGFAGGTSTWSTLAGEVGERLSQHFWRALGYLFLTLIGGVACAFTGVILPPLFGF